MWYSFLAVTVVSASLFVVSCQPDEHSPADVVPLTSRDSSIVMRNDGCEGDGSTCCVVEISIPVFSGGYQGAADSLNKRIRAYFVSLLGSNVTNDSVLPDIMDASRNLMIEFREFQADFPMARIGWEVRGAAKVVANDSIICTQMESYTYLGGAHGIWTLEYDVARSATGDTLDILDFVTDRKAFLSTVERAFKKAVGMSEKDGDYGSQGFWFKNNEFKLPENIGISTDSVLFYYDVYEIAPYSMGTVQFSLPRSVAR